MAGILHLLQIRRTLFSVIFYLLHEKESKKHRQCYKKIPPLDYFLDKTLFSLMLKLQEKPFMVLLYTTGYNTLCILVYDASAVHRKSERTENTTSPLLSMKPA